MSVVDGFISNVDGHAPSMSYESDAVQHQVSTAKTYEAYGANLAASTIAYLDEHVDESASSIDIVNAFLTAIRRTALTAPLDSVGKPAIASVIPLQLLANAAGTGELEFSAREDGKLADEVVSFTWVPADVPFATMIPREQQRIVSAGGRAAPGGFANEQHR